MNPFEKTFSKAVKAPDAPSNQANNSEAMTDVLHRIAAYKSIRIGTNKKAYSKRLMLGTRQDIQAAVCEHTGIVYGLMMPAVVGSAMLVESPFSRYDNCRGLVANGVPYLRTLDAQILAGILLTLASHYELFRYQPSDTGAQKNALLRTVDRECLIDAITFIEHWVNSTSAFYIPKLSLVLDSVDQVNGLNSRFKEWLKTALAAIYKPDRESYEEAVTPKRSISVPTISRARKESLAMRKEFRGWRKNAKEDITELFASKRISLKLKTYLLAVITEDNIASADAGMIDLLVTKLVSLDSTIADSLANSIKRFHNALSSQEDYNDWDKEGTSFSSGQVGDTLTEAKPEAAPESNDSLEPSQTNDAAILSDSMEASDSVEGQPKPMSFIERMKEKKRLAALAAQKGDSNV